MKAFDPGLLLVNFAGILIGGFAEGSVLKLAKNQPDYKLKSGSTGEQLAVRVRDNSGYVEFHLSQSSSSNDALSAKRLIGLAGGPFTGALLIRDLTGTTIVNGDGCFIEGMPEAEFGDEGKDRVWKIIVPDMTAFIGGNTVAI